MIRLIQGECLKVMDELIVEGVKVDAIITDPPYGTTACSWDNVIPFEEMWKKIKLIRKDDSAVVLFGSEPFSSQLRTSNLKEFKYDWIWQKEQGANFMLMKYQPYKVHEIISVFYKHKYNPQLTFGATYTSGGGTSGDITGNVKKKKNENKGTRYPISIQKMATDKSKSQHPTQKPVKLLEYLVNTYTNKGDIVLDFTMGSGTTGVACKSRERNFIGIELDIDYFKIAKERIENEGNQLSLF